MRKKKRCKRRNPQRRTYHGTLGKVSRSRRGRAALSRFRKFWGIRDVPSLKVLPGPGVLVSMGKSPAVTIANGPNKRKATRITRKRHNRMVATDASGRRIYIIGSQGLPAKPKLTFIGWAAKTEYIPSKDIEKAGTGKRGKHWIHDHTDEGGRWPKLYADQRGNYHYGRGTYSVSDWIRK